jgi:T5SS/PEP-CTERM-associated repeat protein
MDIHALHREISDVPFSCPTWTSSYDLTVGSYGAGTLSINAGGAVAFSGTTYVAAKPGSTGTISFGDGGGTLTTGALAASPGQLSGTGTVNTRGLISDVDLVLDSPASLKQTLLFNGQPDQLVTVNLDLASTPTGNDTLGAGWNANGSLMVRNGVVVQSKSGVIGGCSGSTGVVTIVGAGSTWTDTGTLYVGDYGNGALNATGGGTISTGSSTTVGRNPGSTGVVTVAGAGSKWNSARTIVLAVSGRLNITGGGSVSISGNCQIGEDPAGLTDDVARVDGTGSTLTASGSLLVGRSCSGTANITGGGAVTATSASVYGQSFLAIDVGRGSSLAVGSTGITNNGTVRILAAAGVAAGSTHTPISAGKWTGSGTYQAVGGTWNASTHQFTASDVQTGASGTPIAIDLGQKQRVLVSDSQTGRSIGASFLAKPTSAPLTLLASVMDDDTLTTLENLLSPGQLVLGDWSFTTAGAYTPGDPAYLSFRIGAGYSSDELEVWRFDGALWGPYASTDLTYDGAYVSFTATDLRGFAVTVPEPATLTMLFGIAAGVLAVRSVPRPWSLKLRIFVGRVSRPGFFRVWPVGPGDPTYENPAKRSQRNFKGPGRWQGVSGRRLSQPRVLCLRCQEGERKK